MPRTSVGYVRGQRGRFARVPFFSLRLNPEQCRRLDELLKRIDADSRHGSTLTITHEQPDRIRVTETEAPDYELRAAEQYVRGDVIRIQGKEGISCGLDISAKFGIPLVRQQLAQALAKAKDFVELRIPNRARDVIEFIPDTDLKGSLRDDSDLLAEASAKLAAEVLEPEDFSDWED